MSEKFNLLKNGLDNRRGAGATRDERGESSASQQNSDPYVVMEDMVIELRKRVEDLEDQGIGIKPMSPLSLDASNRDIAQKINYIIQAFNKLATSSSKGYL